MSLHMLDTYSPLYLVLTFVTLTTISLIPLYIYVFQSSVGTLNYRIHMLWTGQNKYLSREHIHQLLRSIQPYKSISQDFWSASSRLIFSNIMLLHYLRII